jgi:hypothetical protein
MFAKLLSATALTLVLSASAFAGDSHFEENGSGQDAAVQACMDLNEYAPTELVDAVDDGLGDYLVWVKDRDGDLWMCNANADGAVYANVIMEGDLLEGDGMRMISNDQPAEQEGGGGRGRPDFQHLTNMDDLAIQDRSRPDFGHEDGTSGGGSGGGSVDPAANAEAVCAAVGASVESMQIVATVEDGLGDYLVWLQNDDSELWMCNASTEAEVYAFEPVDYPINDMGGSGGGNEACSDDRDA